MAFVLAQVRADYSLSSIPHQLQTAKIIEHCDRSSAENFEPFLGVGAIAVGKIVDRPLRSICKFQAHDRLVIYRQRASVYFDWQRTRKKAQQVDKVAHLAKNSASALLVIVDPMVGRQRSGINAVVHGQRLVDVLYE